MPAASSSSPVVRCRFFSRSAVAPRWQQLLGAARTTKPAVRPLAVAAVCRRPCGALLLPGFPGGPTTYGGRRHRERSGRQRHRASERRPSRRGYLAAGRPGPAQLQIRAHPKGRGRQWRPARASAAGTVSSGVPGSVFATSSGWSSSAAEPAGNTPALPPGRWGPPSTLRRQAAQDRQRNGCPSHPTQRALAGPAAGTRRLLPRAALRCSPSSR